MKTIALLLFCSITFCHPFKTTPVTPESAVPAVAATQADTVSFAQQIQPILQTRCSPCHFPGGKMYEKMPFDQPKTLMEHAEGITKRFKEEPENSLMKRFIEESGK